jgi:N-dimethylarginine dimethylaminohydrolase
MSAAVTGSRSALREAAGRAGPRDAAWRPRDYVMCPPTHFAVRYRINPWMDPQRPVDAAQALQEWRHLHDVLIGLGHRVTVIDAHPELPDMVFAANGGVLIGDRALVSRFRFPQRGAESQHFRTAFDAMGIRRVRDARFVNEGEGDFRVVAGRILAGNGFRSELRAVDEVAEFFERPVTSLTLVDPRLYHLDTALAVLDDDTVLYWPAAFGAASRDWLAAHYPDALIAEESDAVSLALNLVSDGRTVVLAPGHARLADRIRERGFRVVTSSTDELRKAGGGAKCCVLERHRD